MLWRCWATIHGVFSWGSSRVIGTAKPCSKFQRRHHPRPQAQARAALTVALVQAVEQLIVIGSFAQKECCGWEGNAG